jgi:hypothetical protein
MEVWTRDALEFGTLTWLRGGSSEISHPFFDIYTNLRTGSSWVISPSYQSDNDRLKTTVTNVLPTSSQSFRLRKP